MSNNRWHAPVDPNCPAVLAQRAAYRNDPIMQESGCEEEFMEDFETRHRAKCERCKQFGAANIEVV